MTTIDITSAVQQSVEDGMKRVGLPDTPRNRVNVLNGMHATVFAEGKLKDAPILRAIEDEIVSLQAQLG